jgi:hypothetical protein
MCFLDLGLVVGLSYSLRFLRGLKDLTVKISFLDMREQREEDKKLMIKKGGMEGIKLGRFDREYGWKMDCMLHGYLQRYKLRKKREI